MKGTDLRTLGDSPLKPVPGFTMFVSLGKDLPRPIKPYLGGDVSPESFYVVSLDKETVIHGGPYATEERAFGDVSAITDTSGT